MSRPPLADPPECPRGHAGAAGYRVQRAGTYGRGGRQLYSCIAPDGSRHRFAPALPREHTNGDICVACDTALQPHIGPVVTRYYVHRLHLVAEALAQVGTGVSYAHASNRARVGAGRAPTWGPGGGHLASEWLDAWGPVISAAMAETDQPETLVLDSTDFWWTNARTKARRREFAVLVAYGYPAPGSANPRPRAWGIYASPTARTADWTTLLTSLNLLAAPTSVVTDDNLAVAAAVRRMWPPRHGTPPHVHLCEHHLRANAVKALAEDQVAHQGSIRMDALNDAFHTSAGWAAFRATVTAKHAATSAWVAGVDARVAAQVAIRDQLPQHYTTAGAEAATARLKTQLQLRSFSLRNKARTNRMLDLARLHLNGLDDVGNYHRILRAAAERAGGRGARQGINRDPRGVASLR